MISVFAVIFSLFSLSTCQTLTISQFTNDVICDVPARVTKGCSRKVTSIRRIIQCLSLCGPDVTCVGASLDDNGQCFLHMLCPDITSCSVVSSNHRYLSRYCVHGTWNSTTHSCDCFFHASGLRCNMYFQNCSDLITNGYEFGDHRMYMDPDQDGLNPLLVTCRTRNPDNWSIIVMRSEGKINFNRTWEEYKKGFYVDTYNVWGGLEIWHQLSNAGCNDMRTVATFTYKPITRLIRIHEQFFLLDEASSYSFQFSSSSDAFKGNPPAGAYYGDCFSPIQNKPFSTWDKDRDGDGSNNCASNAGSGWWYSGCNNPCNLMGYGHGYWSTKPSQELFSVIGIDMQAEAPQIAYLTMYLKCS